MSGVDTSVYYIHASMHDCLSVPAWALPNKILPPKPVNISKLDLVHLVLDSSLFFFGKGPKKAACYYVNSFIILYL